MEAMRNIRGNLKRLRRLLRLTQQGVAELADIDYNYYQKIESGRWDGLQVRTVEKLANALGVGIWELFLPCSETSDAPPTSEHRR
jgi:transcriptional regulator with XRE-family HTH domain